MKKYRRRLAKSLFAAILILAVEFGLHISVVNHIPPNTFLGSINVSGKTESEVIDLIGTLVNHPLELSIGDRVYPLRYGQMDIRIDSEATIDQLNEPVPRWFPGSVIGWVRTFGKNRTVDPVLVFGKQYPPFIESFSRVEEIKPELAVNQDNKQLEVVRNGVVRAIDSGRLSQLIVSNFTNPTRITPPYAVRSDIAEAHTVETNRTLANSFAIPLTVTTSRDTITFTPETLKRMLALTVDTATQKPTLSLDTYALFTALGKQNTAMFPQAKQQVLGAMTQRIAGENVPNITVSPPDKNRNDITHSPTYIEIHINKQEMTTYAYGAEVKRYRISTGLYYPTPVGKFKILNKAENAFSKIFNVYMPYWMAFGYSNELDAYFGIHELPYWVTDNGTKIQRPRERIGTPSTGGCVALDIGESKEVYDFAQIGTPVVIFQE